MATPVCTIDATGIHKPAYAEVLAYFKAQYQAIYGDDVYLEPDSQDGEFLALLALAVDDSNSMAVAVYNAFSPSSAQGVGLSRVVKINGLNRATATYSVADILIVGQAGTIITDGIVSDAQGNQWLLPATVTIPAEGEITATATCAVIGAIQAGANTINQIFTPTRGWQTATNPAAASIGQPVERDPALRQRQAVSTQIPSQTLFEGTWGALAALSGVTRLRGYENASGVTDALTVPAHSIAFVVDGGDATAIAATIAAKKGPGCGTFGTTTETVTDSFGVARAIKFSRPVVVPITYEVTIKAKAGYTIVTENDIKQAMADYTNAIAIGDGIEIARTYVPAQLNGSSDNKRYELKSVKLSRDGGAVGTTDIAVAYNEAVACDVANVTITVVP